ncbi:(2Fe-2S)-binding protein [Treponema sp. OMZ 792]|uniref:(2Fe-2S)-binding protein n=1 Tax=unclassified Treponema TaxID=2638727 RepID=UPI0020A5C494|nr:MULTISPECIES: (2Fe-2S)-binding protein [unclassified Treponema]UTC64697.1 (2Fe-2S)-binding protein [Treponema sp. OMZ 788]UTC75175.1 (2Fe-2S)-binding protein [Treponema sp. OMZ 792]UTC79031.1 (2Fe-2S)-binding protein [Treponema sp. OMZ 799]UTC79181.1 (2Fe-2S)-binding protein [Treponema sp. OMZ 798]
MKINTIINGRPIEAEVDEKMRLIDFLRDEVNLTGTKEGCSEGECGACTVIMDKRAVTSCTVLAGQIDGCEILTIEGLAQNGELDILQKKFIEYGAVQCGFCTPGFIMSAKALMMNNKNPSLHEIKRAIEGNICRCTGYIKIIEAIEAAIKEAN